MQERLKIEAVIGFNGSVPNGLLLHPDDKHLITPLGSTIVVKHILKSTQRFLEKDGHDREVSCLILSPTGRYLASGQRTHMGFPAVVIIWDLTEGTVYKKLQLHKGKIQDLAFSNDEKYLATLGGADDNKLVIWNVATGDAVCGSPAHNEEAKCVTYLNKSSDQLVTGGKYNLRVWQFDLANRKIRPTDCQLGQLKRTINFVTVAPDDHMMYCGTASGDILEINVDSKMFQQMGPKYTNPNSQSQKAKMQAPFSQGVKAILRCEDGSLILGGGDGTIAQMNAQLVIKQRMKLEGSITSLVFNKARDHFFVGTDLSNIYLVHLESFEYELRNSSHFGAINDVTYPANYSELFVTSSKNDIRVWNARNRNELLRIQVPNLECFSVVLTKDGKSILSGWSDGKIRSFMPESGKLQYAINDAHTGAVSAVAASSDGSQIVSGGIDGRVRIWTIGPKTQIMRASLKEHKGKVTSVQIKSDDTEFVSASQDGSCIIWDLKSCVRINAFFAATSFQSIMYHTDESQYVTTGTDRKITYWDATDMHEIRIVDGSEDGEINCLGISPDGESFVSAGGDKLVKLWNYDEGFCNFVGLGHSDAVNMACISPDQKTIVSVGREGAIFLWKFPEFKKSANSGEAGAEIVKEKIKETGEKEVGGEDISVDKKETN